MFLVFNIVVYLLYFCKLMFLDDRSRILHTRFGEAITLPSKINVWKLSAVKTCRNFLYIVLGKWVKKSKVIQVILL